MRIQPDCIVMRRLPEFHRARPASGQIRGGILQDFAFFEALDSPALLRATAWRTSALKADSSITSPSWMSIARRTLPSRLELKRRAGSFSDAPPGEGQLRDILVGFACTDVAIVRPHRRAHPLPLLDDVRVGILDERAPPTGACADSRSDPTRLRAVR